MGPRTPRNESQLLRAGRSIIEVVAEASRVWRRKWSTRRKWSFLEVVLPLILLGLFLEFLFLFVMKTAAVEWLLVLPAVGTLLGLMWLVSREPANL